MPYSTVSFRMTLSDLECQNIQRHEASRGLSATVELLVRSIAVFYVRVCCHILAVLNGFSK